jgi:MFS family permease
MPFFIIFGKLSDRVGRKKVMLAGFLLASLTYIPIFSALTYYGNPELASASAHSPVIVQANNCHFNIFAKPSSACDKAKDFLSKAGISYKSEPGPDGQDLITQIGSFELKGFDPAAYQKAIVDAGYPSKANPTKINKGMIIFLLTILVIYVAMVYGPIAAFLTELFPTKIRYSAISLPYHIGNGWFGGFLPFFSAATVVYTGNIYAGLYYPMGIALLSLVLGFLFIPQRSGQDLHTVS